MGSRRVSEGLQKTTRKGLFIKQKGLWGPGGFIRGPEGVQMSFIKGPMGSRGVIEGFQRASRKGLEGSKESIGICNARHRGLRNSSVFAMPSIGV